MKRTISLVLTLAMLIGMFAGLTINASAATYTFKDVSSSHWAYNAVDWAIDNGITKGVGDNRFDPNADCTETQILTMIYRYEGRPSYTNHTFANLNASNWEYPAVCWAIDKGLVVNGDMMPAGIGFMNMAKRRPEPPFGRSGCFLVNVGRSLNVFNHRTSVNIESRIVSYDIKELGKQLKKIGMLIVQDQVWNRVTINREARKSTRYYIDEMHLLLREEQTAAYTVEIWKRFRKWGGIPTGITQNVKDLLSSREVENIFENSDYVYMLNQAAGDRQILAKQLNISPHQLSYVTHSGEGEGLIFYGSTILPFVDRFPRDTELYRIMTTRFTDTAETSEA